MDEACRSSVSSRAAVAITTRRAVHRAGHGIKVLQLNAGPDVLNETTNPFDPLWIRHDLSKLDHGFFRLGDDGELQANRFVRETLNQLVIDEQLTFARVDVPR